MKKLKLIFLSMILLVAQLNGVKINFITEPFESKYDEEDVGNKMLGGLEDEASCEPEYETIEVDDEDFESYMNISGNESKPNRDGFITLNISYDNFRNIIESQKNVSASPRSCSLTHCNVLTDSSPSTAVGFDGSACGVPESYSPSSVVGFVFSVKFLEYVNNPARTKSELESLLKIISAQSCVLEEDFINKKKWKEQCCKFKKGKKNNIQEFCSASDEVRQACSECCLSSDKLSLLYGQRVEHDKLLAEEEIFKEEVRKRFLSVKPHLSVDFFKNFFDDKFWKKKNSDFVKKMRNIFQDIIKEKEFEECFIRDFNQTIDDELCVRSDYEDGMDQIRKSVEALNKNARIIKEELKENFLTCDDKDNRRIENGSRALIKKRKEVGIEIFNSEKKRLDEHLEEDMGAYLKRKQEYINFFVNYVISYFHTEEEQTISKCVADVISEEQSKGVPVNKDFLLKILEYRKSLVLQRLQEMNPCEEKVELDIVKKASTFRVITPKQDIVDQKITDQEPEDVAGDGFDLPFFSNDPNSPFFKRSPLNRCSSCKLPQTPTSPPKFETASFNGRFGSVDYLIKLFPMQAGEAQASFDWRSSSDTICTDILLINKYKDKKDCFTSKRDACGVRDIPCFECDDKMSPSSRRSNRLDLFHYYNLPVKAFKKFGIVFKKIDRSDKCSETCFVKCFGRLEWEGHKVLGFFEILIDKNGECFHQFFVPLNKALYDLQSEEKDNFLKGGSPAQGDSPSIQRNDSPAQRDKIYLNREDKIKLFTNTKNALEGFLVEGSSELSNDEKTLYQDEINKLNKILNEKI